MLGEKVEPKPAMFISVEGLSGVGKTETAQLIASMTSGEFLRLTIDFNDAKKLMILPKHVDARMCLFVTAMLYSSVKIEERLRNGVTVVVDGYVARTLAYHRGMGATVELAFGSAMRMPDCSVMLCCEEEERRRRIDTRGRDRSLWDKIELSNLKEIQTLYERNNFPRVDTTRKPISDVAAEVLSICNKTLQRRIA